MLTENLSGDTKGLLLSCWNDQSHSNPLLGHIHLTLHTLSAALQWH